METKDFLKFASLGVGIVVVGDIVKSSGMYIFSRRKEIYKTIEDIVDENTVLSVASGSMAGACLLAAIENNIEEVISIQNRVHIGIYFEIKQIVKDTVLTIKLKNGFLIASGICFAILSVYFYSNKKSSKPNQEKSNYPQDSTPIQSIYPNLPQVLPRVLPSVNS
jgi:hypothetical protein